MAYEILMPQLGLTMEEGTVSQWIKHEGDAVKAGDVVAEITTDKLTHELQSEHDGVLLKIVAQEGEDVPVKGVLAYIGEAGESITAAPAAAPAAAESVPAAASPAAAAPTADGRRIRISPLARKTAAKLGVTDFAAIVGSGTSGRITQKDILAAAEAMKTAPAPAPLSVAAASASEPAAPKAGLELMEGDTVVKLSGMRKVVAERMLHSHTEIPPVTQNTKVDVTELMKFRKLLLAETGRKYSVNDLILKATAKMLRQHPEILVSYDNGQMIQRAHVNIGMAVALEAGLIVPVIRDADRLGLDALADSAKDLASRAKGNKLLPDEYKGSTFSVSNLGMFGIETFTPIVNQPDAAILGVCAVQDELTLAEDGSVSKRQVMRLSFTYDHRLIDGATAAKFVMDLRDLLQSPMCIVL
ncbi:2-oxo acid dehydrogenase subunit E2 [Dysosmobacter sp. NSJ-60]|uniref:Dihydrolipoamide acetyltransferase component of pyruvate dehydrogenase complex n=1 Tax=Pusillibacter faecalis TaxID=2714358 RepID=A0A810QMT0_9FIRM|nr:dihydrolipoamide acetyltransferase family protein [Pusillibacter faecalis]MBC5747948.1 2-oxo acid dehydrogenase subunit E2 [Dysosmobacter hominis]BCK85473.1 dihydrolipoamide acetyltransferase component of pyruvate dehydrogenase complex [Pusillibacter faecalis]